MTISRAERVNDDNHTLHGRGFWKYGKSSFVRDYESISVIIHKLLNLHDAHKYKSTLPGVVWSATSSQSWSLKELRTTR